MTKKTNHNRAEALKAFTRALYHFTSTVLTETAELK